MTYLLEDDYEKLVELIYQIPLDTTAWATFAKKLIQLLDASYVHIQSIDFSYNVLSYSNGIGKMPLETYAQAEMSYLHYPKDADPRWTEFLNPKRQGWYQCHKHVDEAFVQQSDLYQNILLPMGLRFVASHELIWDEKLCVFWSVSTTFERQPLNQTELAFLDRLTAHLKRVISIQRHLYEFSSKAVVGYAIVDKLTQPILLLNLSGQVVHANKSACLFIEHSNMAKIDAQRLILSEPYQTELTENLYKIEALFRQKTDLEQTLKDNYIQFTDKEGEISYIFINLLVSEQEKLIFGIRPLVMLTFYQPQHAAIGVSYLYKVFDCLNHGVILLDQESRLFYRNISAQHILEKTSLLTLDQNNKLKTKSQFQGRLNTLILGALSQNIQADTENLSHGGVLALYESMDETALMLHVIPISQISKLNSYHQPDGIVAIFLKQTNKTYPLVTEYLKQMYNLTKRELQVCEYFVQGMNLEQISKQCEITLTTLRTYLKRIFAKTKCSSQSDLMKLLLNTTINVQPIQ